MANSTGQQIGIVFGVKGSGINGTSGKEIRKQLKIIADDISKSGKYTQVKFSVDEKRTQTQIQKQLNQIAKGLTIKIGGFDQSTIQQNAKKQVDALTRQVNNASNKLAGMGGNDDILKYGNVAKIAEQFKTYTKAVNEAKAAEKAMNDSRNPQTQQAFIDKFRIAANEQKKLEAAFKNSTALDKQSLAYNKVIARITEYQAKNKETLKNTPELAAKLEELNQQLSNGTFKGTKTDAQNRFLELTNQIRKAGGEAETLWQKVKRIFGEKLGYGIIASAAMMARRSIREMYNNVVQIDTAMTELKKVTNETDESYRRFLDGSAERAQKLGATISDVVTATADFARLGYNLEDASILSDAATVYKNVGDGITDINDASESIISTMKAFGYEASSVMEIVDKFNTTGNKFSISSGGVGEALLNSASALSAAGNTLDESIALITAANETIQNPEKVGTAMKTLSLYLRAAKTEAEEAGISTDGMANSVSELRDELLALTGNRVDIMISDDDFKSTGQIIIELSKVWSSLSETSQANITELIGGGVRNANVVSALIQNASKIDEIASASANSAGSALEENEKYLDSINGKVAQLEATFQDLSQNVIDSETVKGFVDLGNGALKLVNFLAEIKALLPAIVAGFMSWKNVGKLNSPNMPAYAQLQLVA